MKRDQKKTKETAAEAIKDFAKAYFFIFRIQLNNAHLLWKKMLPIQGNNYVFNELVKGYVNNAVSEFALCLYDAIEHLKIVDSRYRYPSGSAIDAVMKFRRNIISHRGMNWGSTESTAVINAVSEKPSEIFDLSSRAANEFVQEIKKRGLHLDPGTQWPVIPTIRSPELKTLVNALPEMQLHAAIPSEAEVSDFFGPEFIESK